MKKAIAIGVPVIALLGLVGWRYTQKQQSDATLAKVGAQRKTAAVNVELATAGPRNIIQSLQSVGTVESPFNVNLSPKLTGRIVYLDVREGASVTTGQTLVKIDPAETEGQVLQAKSALAQARSSLASAQITQAPTNANIQSQIGQSEATVRSNRADLDQVKQNYDATVQAAHSSVVDAEAKVSAASSGVANAKASLQSAIASLENANAKFNRENTLYKQGYVAAQDVDDSRTAVKVAKSAVDVADGQVKGAVSAERSANAILQAAQNAESIAIKKGTTDIRSAQAKVDLAKAALNYAYANRAQSPAYAAQVGALQAAVDAALGNLNQAEARLADLNLISSIDGTITKRSADPGMVVNAGQSVLTVQYLKWLYVTSAVPVEYSGKVIVGSPVKILFDSLPGKNFTGTVTELNRAADLQNRQFMIRVKLDNADGALRPGMYAQVYVQLSKIFEPIVVPREAVTTTNQGTSTVTTIDSSNKAKIVPVKIGEQDTEGIAITSGLEAGQKVVKLSYSPVRNGQTVTEGGKTGNGKSGRKGSASKK